MTSANVPLHALTGPHCRHPHGNFASAQGCPNAISNSLCILLQEAADFLGKWKALRHYSGEDPCFILQ